MSSLAQGLTGVALVIALGLLSVRQLSVAVTLLTVQSIAVAIAAAAQPQVSAAVAEVFFQVCAAPILLHRLMSRMGTSRTSLPVGGAKLVITAGGLLTMIALTWDSLGLPLAIVLVALLLMATRQHPLMHLIGLLALQNGVVLAAAGIAWAGIDIVVLPVIPLLAGIALWVHTRERAA